MHKWHVLVDRLKVDVRSVPISFTIEHSQGSYKWSMRSCCGILSNWPKSSRSQDVVSRKSNIFESSWSSVEGMPNDGESNKDDPEPPNGAQYASLEG